MEQNRRGGMDRRKGYTQAQWAAHGGEGSIDPRGHEPTWDKRKGVERRAGWIAAAPIVPRTIAG